MTYRPDWQTPPEWIEWAARTLGGIDLDPCAAPGQDVAARDNLGPEFGDPSGLDIEWRGDTYANVPGANSVKSVKPWWAHALDELAAARCTSLVWCFFNCEHVRHVKPSPLSLPGWMVMPDKRVQFWLDGKPRKGARNWAWFWTTTDPDRDLPLDSWIVETGPTTTDTIAEFLQRYE